MFAQHSLYNGSNIIAKMLFFFNEASQDGLVQRAAHQILGEGISNRERCKKSHRYRDGVSVIKDYTLDYSQQEVLVYAHLLFFQCHLEDYLIEYLGAIPLKPIFWIILSNLGWPVPRAVYIAVLKYNGCTWSFSLAPGIIWAVFMGHFHFVYTKVLAPSHHSFLFLFLFFTS